MLSFTKTSLVSHVSTPGSAVSHSHIPLPATSLRTAPFARDRVTLASAASHKTKSLGSDMPDAKALNSVLHRHLENEGHLARASAYHAEFRDTGFVEIPNIVPNAVWRDAYEKSRAVLHRHGVERTAPNPYSGTARKFSSAGNRPVRANVSLLNGIYRSPVMLDFLSKVFGTKTTPLGKKYKLDEFVVHELSKKDHQLGLHIDPAMGSTVWILKEPPKNVGAEVEFYRLPQEAYDKHGTLDPGGVTELAQRYPESKQLRQPATNSMYLLAASKLPHAVSRLERTLAPGEERTNVTFSYAQKEIDHRPPAYKADVYLKEVVNAFPEATTG